jgi:hypothetical protein
MDRQKTEASSILGEWQNWVVLIVAVIAVTPSYLLASLYLVAIRAAVRVGHWPYLGNPDASAMAEDLQPGSGPLAGIVPLAVYVVSAALFVMAVVRCSRRPWRIFVSVAAGTLTWMLLTAVFLLDPAGVWQWIMD